MDSTFLELIGVLGDEETVDYAALRRAREQRLEKLNQTLSKAFPEAALGRQGVKASCAFNPHQGTRFEPAVMGAE